MAEFLRLHPVEPQRCRMRFRAGAALALVVERGHLCMGAVVLQPGVTGPTHAGEEPGTTLPAMKSAKAFPRPHGGFLHDLFRVLVMTRQPAGHVVSGMEMRYDRVFKPCAYG